MYEVKVKHVDRLISGEDNSPFELLGIKNTWYNRIRYRNAFYIFNYNLREFLDLDIKELKYVSCALKVPKNIDNITFKRMMSLTSYNTQGKSLSQVIRDKISLVCAEENNMSEREVGYVVNNMPFKEAMGILNWINDNLKTSQQQWEKRFLSVNVPDEDYDKAGGRAAMAQFNVINTLKNACRDFNVTYEEAWELPYVLLQTSAYADATGSHVMYKMEQLKKIKMEAKRKLQSHGH